MFTGRGPKSTNRSSRLDVLFIADGAGVPDVLLDLLRIALGSSYNN